MGSIGEIAFVGEQGGCSKLSLWLISLPSILAHGSNSALASMLLCVCVWLCATAPWSPSDPTLHMP